MDLSKHRRDEKIEVEGKWFPIDNETSLLIARAYTKKYADLFREATRPYKFQLDNDMMDEEVSAEIMAGIMSKCVLLDWKGLRIDGSAVSYSQEKAYEILKDRQYRDFAKMVDSMSKDAASFRQQGMEENSKNLDSTSDGT